MIVSQTVSPGRGETPPSTTLEACDTLSLQDTVSALRNGRTEGAEIAITRMDMDEVTQQGVDLNKDSVSQWRSVAETDDEAEESVDSHTLVLMEMPPSIGGNPTSQKSQAWVQGTTLTVANKIGVTFGTGYKCDWTF